MRGLILIALFLMPCVGQAAQLLVLPVASTHAVGDAFTLSVAVSSASQAMNAAQGLVSFPPDLLEVLSIQKQGIFNLWVKEPAFSNSAGTLSFEGIVLNPGYQGAQGTLFSFVVRAKRAGTATLSLANATVLANDGSGTSILDDSRSATVVIEPRAPLEEPSATPAVTTPPVIRADSVTITSPSHPDQISWYRNKHALMRFAIPTGVDALRTLLDQEPRSTPTVVYAPPVLEKELRDLEDGIWYFHAGARIHGVWGPTSHRALRVDTTPPYSLDATVEERPDPSDPYVTVRLTAKDELSGIDYYEIDAGEGIKVATTSARVRIGPLSFGERRISVRAVDGAGNARDGEVTVSIQPLEAPTITAYPLTLAKGAPLWARGLSKYPDATVYLRLEQTGHGPKEYEAHTDMDGGFYVSVGEEMPRGTYHISAYVVDARGARSPFSPAVAVTGSEWLVFDPAVLLYSLISLLIALLAILYSIYRVRKIKRSVRREVHEARKRITETLRLLRADAKDITQAAKDSHKERRAPTEAEMEAIAQLKSDLEEIDSLLESKLDDIEKETG